MPDFIIDFRITLVDVSILILNLYINFLIIVEQLSVFLVVSIRLALQCRGRFNKIRNALL